MKWNKTLCTMVLGIGLCAQQSFGFDLLERMLGGGCCGQASNCCAAPILWMRQRMLRSSACNSLLSTSLWLRQLL